MDKVGNEAVPALTAAMTAEMDAFGPKLMDRLTAESLILQNNLNEHMKTSLNGALAEQFGVHKDELKGKLEPFAVDDSLYDDLLRRLQASSQDWAQEELDTTFAEHILILQSINETVIKLSDQAREQREEQGDVTVDDFMLLMTEILDSRINEAG